MYQKVVVPLDKSKDSETVLRALPEVVAAEGAAILLHVVSPGRTRAVGEFVIHGAQQEEQDRNAALAHLKPAAARLGQMSVAASCAVVTSDSVAQCIADFARAENADLIAMYTHARKGLAKLLWGSVAAAVQRRSSVPVRVLGPSEIAQMELEQIGADVA